MWSCPGSNPLPIGGRLLACGSPPACLDKGAKSATQRAVKPQAILPDFALTKGGKSPTQSDSIDCAGGSNQIACLKARFLFCFRDSQPSRQLRRGSSPSHPEHTKFMDFNNTRYIPMSRRRRIYEGKAKVLYEGPEPGTLIQHFKDDATAFN